MAILEDFVLTPTAWLMAGTLVLAFIFKRTLPSLSSSSTSRLPLPPGPRGWEAFRSLIQGARSGSLHVQVSKWGKPGAPITCCSVGSAVQLVSINCPDLAREVFTGRETEGVVNDRPPTFIGRFLFYGPKDLAMASMSPMWTAQRKMFYSSLRLYGDGVHRFESTVKGELAVLLEELAETDGRDICLEDYVSNTLLSILSILMTGERPGKDSEMVDTMRHLDRVVSMMGTPSVDMVLNWMPWVRYLPGWYRTHCQLAIAYRDRLVEILFNHSKNTACADQPRGIVDVMLLAQASKTFCVSDDHVKGLMLDILVGGYVTSLTSFLSTVMVMLNLPHVARAVQAEIDSAVGQRTPTLDDRKNMPYTEAMLLEVLRYMRIFPLGLPHVCSEDTVINGYRIPKNAMILSNQWESGRNNKVWDKADQFLPERFLDEKGELLPADHPRRRNLLPFGIGRRACPGETFARTRLFLLITSLLQQFDIVPPENGDVIPMDNIPWTTGAVFLLPSFKCRVRRRQSVN